MSVVVLDYNSAEPPFAGDGNDSSLEYVVAVITGIACFNAVELVLLIFVTFQKWSGLYFWSLLVASIAVLPYSIGFLLFFFQLTTVRYASLTLITIGWWPMVTGQAVVLYSRLHLICRNRRLLSNIKYMIVFCAVTLHIPTTILTFLAQGPPEGGPYSAQVGYPIFEKIQMTGFCIQEFIISAVYLKETIRFMKAGYSSKRPRILRNLIGINILIILMDLALLGIEYANLYVLETTLKGLVYSIKLRLEFAVLTSLVHYRPTPERGTMETASLNGEGCTLARQDTRKDSFVSNVTRPSLSLQLPRSQQRPRTHSIMSTKFEGSGSSHFEHRKDAVEEMDPLDAFPGRISGSSSSNQEEQSHQDFRDFAFEQPES